MNESKGHTMLIGVVAYMIVKLILNILLGGGLDWIGLGILAIVSVFLLRHTKYFNLVCAAWLAVGAIYYLPGNIKGLGSDFRYVIYLAEGVIDLICAVLLLVQPDVKALFQNADISEHTAEKK